MPDRDQSNKIGAPAAGGRRRGTMGSTMAGGVAGAPEPPSPDREPFPRHDTIERQNQHVDRLQDGGREADRARIEKHGGDTQRDDVEHH
ncbi:hypothetical protein STVA_04870 [Allostella vacuolata]|nr:hypothetical protein STVA_04870 [Stella vacuolata]